MEIVARGVNDALHRAVSHILHQGVSDDSRNGPVLRIPEPVVTRYTHPRERVIFSEVRDANPFFHLMESLWMLAGRNDLMWPLKFNSGFAAFSDDGETLNGAYGHRWRKYFKKDQLLEASKMLYDDHTTRRVVIQMWSHDDLGKASKDLPCNTHIYFSVHDDALHMTVCNRSNDMIWGCYGANAVHFSMLQEFMAQSIGCRLGPYTQFSNNLHVYTEKFSEDWLNLLASDVMFTNKYEEHGTDELNWPLMSVPTKYWLNDLDEFLDNPVVATNFNDSFFKKIAQPMYMAYTQRKNGASRAWLSKMPLCDWKLAATDWLTRRGYLD